jgi:hypothetical protein
MANMPEGLPSGKNTSPLTMLGQLLTRNTVNKILLNVQIAAMHLADILKGVRDSIRATLTLTNLLIPD